MKNRYRSFTAVLFALIVSSCSEIIETSIEDKQVTVIAPGDGVTSPVYGVTFWWNPLDNALRYNLQVVSPDFNNVTVLVLDTMVRSTKFTYTLNPGIYEWRIRAENGSSKTPYLTRKLVVDSAGLNNQPMLTRSPSEKFLNSRTVLFSWAPLYGTANYKLEVDTATGNFAGPLVLDQSVPFTSNSYEYNFPSDGRYYWKVKAMNATEESNYSAQKEFIIDTKPPSAPSGLSSPNSGKPVQMSWNSSSDENGIEFYKLYIYKTDSTTLFSSGYPKVISAGSSNSFNEASALTGSKILWRVTSVDHAGNESSFSPYGSFTIGF